MIRHHVTALTLLFSISLLATDTETPVNKLLYMYRFFYLPFSIEFKEGKTPNDILPFVRDGSGTERLIRAEELERLDREWAALKGEWYKKSLLQTTSVPLNQATRITSHLTSHHVSLSRGAFDNVSIDDRIQINHALQSKSPEVQSAFKQLRFLKSFLGPQDEGRFNLFIISASWCESCKEYRTLLETYLKIFSEPSLTLHSVIIEDPKEEIFDSPILKELFPNPKKYSHESIPRFLALETVHGNATVHEEGEALKEVHDRFLKSHRGFLDGKTSVLGKKKKPSNLQPIVSSISK